jgi:predicted nucleotidyltransferase
MTRARVVAGLRQLAISLGSLAYATEWHLFGSVDRDEPDAEDIDLMILCASHTQADSLRSAIKPDLLALPLHLSLMTFQEAAEIDAVRMQRSTLILRLGILDHSESTSRTDAPRRT